MRHELETTFQTNPDHSVTVYHRDQDTGEINDFTVDGDLFTVTINNKRIRMIPVVPRVTLIAATPNMEQVMAAAGRLCYSRSDIATVMEKLPPQEAQRFLAEQIVPAGHHSVIEHALFTFGVEGVSRSFSHQIVRHRHMSFDQQSQRYVDIWKYKAPYWEFIVPPAMRKDCGVFSGYVERLKASLQSYVWALEQGAVGEDARMFLMNASATKMIVSANPRALYEFLAKRTCALAQWEIDQVATAMFELAYPHAPSIFDTAGPGCSRGKCPEGKRCCLITIGPLKNYVGQASYPHDGWNGRVLGDLTLEEQKEAARKMRQQQAMQRKAPIMKEE